MEGTRAAGKGPAKPQAMQSFDIWKVDYDKMDSIVIPKRDWVKGFHLSIEAASEDKTRWPTKPIIKGFDYCGEDSVLIPANYWGFGWNEGLLDDEDFLYRGLDPNFVIYKCDVVKKFTNGDYQILLPADDELTRVPAWVVHTGSTKKNEPPPPSPSEQRAASVKAVKAAKEATRPPGRRTLGPKASSSKRSILPAVAETTSDLESGDEPDTEDRPEIESDYGSDDEDKDEDEEDKDEDGEPSWTEDRPWESDPNHGDMFEPQLKSDKSVKAPSSSNDKPMDWFMFAFPAVLLSLLVTCTNLGAWLSTPQNAQTAGTIPQVAARAQQKKAARSTSTYGRERKRPDY